MAYKDWFERPAKLLNEITTTGGKVYPAGMVVWCCKGWRGRLNLYAAEFKDGKWVEKLKDNGCVQSICRQVHPAELEVVDGKTPEPPVRHFPAPQFELRFNKDEGQFLLSLLNAAQNPFVQCVNNYDFERNFDMGAIYSARNLVFEKKQTLEEAFKKLEFLEVEDKYGNIVKTPPSRFKLVENHGHAAHLAARVKKALS